MSWNRVAGVLFAASCASLAGAAEITFHRDVAPILNRRCVACHRPGEVAPFSLLTYDDAAKRADHLKQVTEEGLMPPWLAEEGPYKFLDERRLTPEELTTIADWVDSGAPEGDPADAPEPPSFPSEWQLGEPDLVLEMPETFDIPADGRDVYQAFVIPIPLDEAKWIRGIEFRPGNRKTVHHVNFMIDGSGETRKLDEQDAGPGFETSGGSELFALQGSGALGVWTPGNTPRLFPEGVARRIEAGTDLVLHIHYHPSGKPETDRSTVGLYYSDKPASRPMATLPVNVSPRHGNLHLLNIPAGAERFEVKLTNVVPADCRPYSIFPHAHYLLREMTVIAATPDGEILPLLEIKNWDFDQQDRFVYEDPPLLPGGTKVSLVAYYDNTDANPNNPTSPPVDVKFGERTTDEMLGVLISLIPEGPEAAAAFRNNARLTSRTPGGATSVEEPLKLPPEGVVLPEPAKLLKERYDADKDGKLSQAEYETIPATMKAQADALLRKAMGNGVASAGTAPFKIPAEGLALPEQATLLREKFDGNKDGRLSQEEFDAIPAAFQGQVRTFFAKRLEGAPPATPPAPTPTPTPTPTPPAPTPTPPAPTPTPSVGSAEPAKVETFRLPAAGVALPAEAAMLRDKFDGDKDGKLSQAEFDAIPEAIRKQVEARLKERFGDAIDAALLLEKHDADKNGRLSRAEFDAVPEDLRGKLDATKIDPAPTSIDAPTPNAVPEEPAEK